MWLLSHLGMGSSTANVLACVSEQHSQPSPWRIDAPNPSEPGDFEYRVLEYGEAAPFFAFWGPDMVAPNVALPDFLADYSRQENYQEDAYHEFDATDLPLEAKVWAPDGDGPFPLVLLVHGNSDPGFDYLGELLVSRGYVVAQIDQTYLNGLWGENGARAWLLLEHLKLWRAWNQDQSSPFHQKIDLERIALVGMSRGGEAVALAAAFNRWRELPGKQGIVDFDFSIKSVIALAPMNGQYLHATGANVITDVNFMVIQGGHDADVYQFLGSRQWLNTRFDGGGDYLKQLLYVYRGNHINFNQDMSGSYHWGQRGDFDENLLSPSEQEHLTQVFVSAFLELSLFDRTEYRALFDRPHVGNYGLPEDIIVSRNAHSQLVLLETFEESMAGTVVSKQVANQPAETLPLDFDFERLRHGTPMPNQVLKLALKRGSETAVRIQASEPLARSILNAGVFTLQFSLARADSNPAANCQKYNLLADAGLELWADSKAIHRQPLGAVGSLAPLLLADFSALESDDFKYPITEPVLQTFKVPMRLTPPQMASLRAAKDVALRLVFNPQQNLQVVLDDVGIEP